MIIIGKVLIWDSSAYFGKWRKKNSDLKNVSSISSLMKINVKKVQAIFVFQKSSSSPNKPIFVREKRRAYNEKSAYYI